MTEKGEQTLAQYIYKRMSDDQVTFQKDRPKSWPAGLFVTSSDIDQYIREYNLHQQNKSSFYDYAEKPKGTDDKGFGYNEHDDTPLVVYDEDHEIDRMLMNGEHGIGYYDVPRKVDVYEEDSGAEYARKEKERKEHLLTLHPFLMYEDVEEKPKDGRWNWYGEGEEE